MWTCSKGKRKKWLETKEILWDLGPFSLSRAGASRKGGRKSTQSFTPLHLGRKMTGHG